MYIVCSPILFEFYSYLRYSTFNFYYIINIPVLLHFYSSSIFQIHYISTPVPFQFYYSSLTNALMCPFQFYIPGIVQFYSSSMSLLFSSSIPVLYLKLQFHSSSTLEIFKFFQLMHTIGYIPVFSSYCSIPVLFKFQFHTSSSSIYASFNPIP